MDQPSIPGYEGLKPIGKGGFSKVFEATQQKFRRQVAIKVLNFGVNDAENRRAFARETQLMGRVSTHPNIVTVYDTAFTDQGQPCIVMELCSGGTIAERIQELGALPPREVLDVGTAIASALHASHQSGVLHRDIKPQNILISDFGQPSLSDFGISAFDDDRAQTGDASGFTLHYAAPEVIEGEPATAQSDVYSLAATLYTAAAGRRPFATPGTKLRPGELARRVLLEQPAPLTNWRVPAEIDAVIAKAMSKEPTDRHHSADAFAAALLAAAPSLEAGVVTPAPASAPQPHDADASPFSQPKPNRTQPDVATVSAPAALDDTDGHTVLRKDLDQQRPQTAEPEPDATQETDDHVPAGRARTLLAVGLPLVALLVVGAVLFLLNDGPEPAEEIVATPTRVPVTAVDPIRAPQTPTNVELRRLTPGEVLVTWSTSDADDDTVTYELRRSDIDAGVASTSDTELLLTDIGGNDQPCVRVLALRGSRLSNETPPVCASLASNWVEVLPNTCRITSCAVRLRVYGLPDDSRVTLQVTDPNDADLNGFAPGAYDTSAELNADGDVIDWRLELGTQLLVGRYQVQVRDDVDITAIGYFDVTE